MINPETGEIISTFYSRSPELNELFSALANAQGEFESAKRAATNPHFKSKYATLEAVLEATADGRKNNKLALIQMPGNGNGNNIAVTTILGHSSGQWIESRFEVAPSKFDAQGAGSIVTYLRRYAAMSILGIAPEDDDGNAAVREPDRVSKPTPSQRAAQPQKATTSASVAPQNGNGDPPRWIGQFLAQESYEIDPKRVGSWSMWERRYLEVADAIDDLDQLTKLCDDNSAHIDAFAETVKPAVWNNFKIRVKANENRLNLEPTFLGEADAETVLRG